MTGFRSDAIRRGPLARASSGFPKNANSANFISRPGQGERVRRAFCSPVRQGGDGSTGQNDFLTRTEKNPKERGVIAGAQIGNGSERAEGQKEAPLRVLLNGLKPALEGVGRQDRGKTARR